MSCYSLVVLILSCALIGGCCSFHQRQQGARSNFSNSLRLTRSIRARVQHLLLLYKQQQFGDSLFEDRRLVLNTLPSVTISYHVWLQMQDTERLSIASHDLYTFWTHLESQRRRLDLDRNEERKSDEERVIQRRNRRGRPQLSLSQTVLGIQLDLRDLMRQVNSQLLTLKTLKQEPTTDYTSTPSPPTAFTSPANPISTLQSSERPSGPPSTSFQTSSRPHSTIGLTLTSTPSDMEAISKRTTVSAGTGEVSGYEGVTKASTITAVEPIPTTQVPGPSSWVSRLEGYVILRDLERYLSRLARDYTLLRAKY